MGAPLITPMLVGAGIGALGGAITGRSPLQTALLGGALGTGYGALSGMGGATAGIQGAVVPSGGAGISLAPAAVGDTSLALTPTALNSGGMFAANSLPTASAELGASGVGGISNLADYATGTGTDLMAKDPTLWEKLKPYATINNAMGAMNVAEKFQPKPRPQLSAPSGGVQRGQAPQTQGGLILSMDDLMKLSQLQQRRPISLLVG